MFGDQPEVLPAAPPQVYGPTRPDLLKQPLEYEPRPEPGFSSLVAEVRRAATIFSFFFFRAQAIEDELRKDQNCLAEE